MDIWWFFFPAMGKDAILSTLREEKGSTPHFTLQAQVPKKLKKKSVWWKNTSSLSLTTFHFRGPFVFSLVHRDFQVIQALISLEKKSKTFLPRIWLSCTAQRTIKKWHEKINHNLFGKYWHHRDEFDLPMGVQLSNTKIEFIYAPDNSWRLSWHSRKVHGP